MSKLKINGLSNSLDTEIVNGAVSVRHAAIGVDEKGNVITEITGSLSMHKYIPDIRDIQSNRYKIIGVDVREELFGSEDYNIIYNFIASGIEVLPETLTEEEIEKIENNIYSYEKDNYGFLYGTGDVK